MRALPANRCIRNASEFFPKSHLWKVNALSEASTRIILSDYHREKRRKKKKNIYFIFHVCNHKIIEIISPWNAKQ